MMGLCAVVILTLASPALASTPPVFGAGEVRNNNLAPFPKWTGVVARYRGEAPLYTAPCTPTTFDRCLLPQWKRSLDSLRGRPRLEQIYAINRAVNGGRYIVDPVNWGVADYWASPLQFFVRHGDCEDYAITKYVSLRMLGIPDDDMRLVILEDQNLKILHAVLLVLARDANGPRWLLLDNQISQVVRADAVRHYRPIYSINEQAWWLHNNP